MVLVLDAPGPLSGWDLTEGRRGGALEEAFDVFVRHGEPLPPELWAEFSFTGREFEARRPFSVDGTLTSSKTLTLALSH